jgi:DNA-binding CsgD family transcriptional regulator
MGRPALGERKYEIQNIWDTHREIMRLLVAGMHHVDIARELNVTPQTVSNVMNSAICKRQMNLMRDARDMDAVDVANRIQEIAPVALQTLEELLCSGNDNIKMKTATDLLDRAGHAAVKTIRTASLSVHLTRDDIDEIQKRAKEIGLCVDAEENESAMVNNLPQLMGALG